MKVFVFDAAKCNGCHSCQVACKDEHAGNDWMPYAKPMPETGMFWYKQNEYVRGSIPKVKVAYVPTLCMHCDEATCIPACPTSAISKREDGLVLIDPAKCNGCQLCVGACPYGTISFNRALRVAQKCTGCAHLLDRGWPIKEPRCADACITGALTFGEEGGHGGADRQGRGDRAQIGPIPEAAGLLSKPAQAICCRHRIRSC